jgi:hypothetical protein
MPRCFDARLYKQNEANSGKFHNMAGVQGGVSENMRTNESQFEISPDGFG